MSAARANVGNRRGQGRASCSIEGCERIVKGRHLCEKHYMRARRHGGDTTAGEGRYGNGFQTADGYVMWSRPGHPLAGTKGQVLARRVVLYDAIGPGPHACHWCGDPVDWMVGTVRGALVTDHRDNDKANNDLSNLVPSCNRCNTCRGRFGWYAEAVA